MDKVEDEIHIRELEDQINKLTLECKALKRKHGLGIYCCKDSEWSSGWNHNTNCKNFVLVY
jgi:hypothetical protein